MKKKNRSPREKVIRRNFVGLFAYTIWGFIYPWIGWVSEDNPEANSQSCGHIISLDTSMMIYSIGYILLVIVLIPILFRRYISTVYIKLCGSLSLFLIGSWFLFMGGLTMLCEPLPYAEKILMPILYTTVLLSFIILFLNRHRMQQVLDINGHMWNFETMEHTQMAIIKRPDGKNSQSVAYIAYLAAFFGPLLANVPIGDWFNLGGSAKSWIMVILFWYAGIFFAGVLALNELYLTWLIYKKSTKLGGKMLVKEFLPNK